MQEITWIALKITPALSFLRLFINAHLSLTHFALCDRMVPDNPSCLWDCSGCELPKDFERLIGIATKDCVNVSYTHATLLPAALFSDRIRAIIASHNHLQSLPRITSTCVLTELDISSNRFTTFPGALASCKCLTNKLAALPPFLGALPVLNVLMVSGNWAPAQAARARSRCCC